jgi:hypothetical protein
MILLVVDWFRTQETTSTPIFSKRDLGAQKGNDISWNSKKTKTRLLMRILNYSNGEKGVVNVFKRR